MAHNIDELLVYALWNLQKEGKSTTFENLVVKAFELFPYEFGLRGFEGKYPDAARVNKAWLRCRTDRGWISGNVAHGFNVTERGEKVLSRLSLSIHQPDRAQKLVGERRTKAGRILSYIEGHVSYKKYKAGAIDTISDFEVCDLFFSTLDALPSVRQDNLKQMLILVKDYKRPDVEKFLGAIMKAKPHLFPSDDKSGGMMAKRGE